MERILQHLQQQKILFGKAKVGKKIELEDLSGTDLQALENAHFQILPEKDSAGRLIGFDSISHRKEVDFGLDSLASVVMD